MIFYEINQKDWWRNYVNGIIDEQREINGVDWFFLHKDECLELINEGLKKYDAYFKAGHGLYFCSESDAIIFMLKYSS